MRENFYSFGRLSTFSYLEYLRIMGLPIDCDDLFFEDKEGSRSNRNGLCKVLGRDVLDWHSSNPEFKGDYTPEQFAWLKKEGDLLLRAAKARHKGREFERDISYFTLESTLCCFKSWFRKNRRYPNCYMDMFHDRIKRMEQSWPEEDFSVFWEARKAYLSSCLRLEDNPADVGLKPLKQNWFQEHGCPPMMDKEWSCFRNGYNDEVDEKQRELIV